MEDTVKKMSLEEAREKGIKLIKSTCIIENIDEFNELLEQLQKTVDKIKKFQPKIKYKPVEDVTNE